MMQNGYLLAKIGADTAKNEQQFAEILPKIGNYPTGGCSGAALLPPSAWLLRGAKERRTARRRRPAAKLGVRG